MKKLFTLLLLIGFSFSYSQSSYCVGWEKGYQKGLDSCLEVGITPICPIPEIGADSYNDGYGMGYAKAKQKCNLSKQTTSTVTFGNADPTLVAGARDAAPKFNGYTNDVANSFNNVMRYASSSSNNSSNNNTSNQYSSARQTLNSAIRSAKFQKKSIKKASKDLLKLLLKTGEIKKGDERYLKLKAEADFGYDPRTEKDPVLVAMENHRTLSDEKLYGVSDISYFDNFNSGELPLSVDEVRSRFKNEYYLYLDESGNVLFFNEIDYNSIEKGKIKYFVLSNWAGDFSGSEGYSIFYNIDSEYNPTNPFLNFVYDNTGKKVYRIDINEDSTYSINKL